MDTIKLIIPRVLVERHYPHPEEYGESIIKLVNGMTTDVYTDENGKLFSITNDQELIDYINNEKKEENLIILTKQSVQLKTLEYLYKDILAKWFNSLDNFEHNEENIIYFISHSFTSLSHQFIISLNNEKIGLCGFSIVNKTAYLNFDFYQKKISQKEGTNVFKLLSTYLKEHYLIEEMMTIILVEDIKKLLFYYENGFSNIANSIIPTSKTEYKRVYLLAKKLPKYN